MLFYTLHSRQIFFHSRKYGRNLSSKILPIQILYGRKHSLIGDNSQPRLRFDIQLLYKKKVLYQIILSSHNKKNYPSNIFRMQDSPFRFDNRAQLYFIQKNSCFLAI